MPRVIHFELPTQNPERATKFYNDVFGWESSKWDGPIEYWLTKTGDDAQTGINGGFMHCPDGKATVSVTLDVPSVDDYVVKATAAGATVVMPKAAIPGIGYIAYIKDTEGNMIGMMQPDPKAA